MAARAPTARGCRIAGDRKHPSGKGGKTMRDLFGHSTFSAADKTDTENGNAPESDSDKIARLEKELDEQKRLVDNLRPALGPNHPLGYRSGVVGIF